MTSRTLFPNIYNRRIDTLNASVCLGQSVGRIDGRTSMRVGVDNGASRRRRIGWRRRQPASGVRWGGRLGVVRI